MINLGFMASNNGSSARAIMAAIAEGSLDARARLVVSNRKTAPILDFAREHGVPAQYLPTVSDADAADARLLAAMRDAGVDWIILSGYLRKLGPRTLGGYDGRILNIHPALLPKYGGQGMYGRRVHEAVIAARETVTGASVHFVDNEYDHGAVVAQVEVPVRAGDTPLDIEQRVIAAEPALFVKTLRKIADG